MLGLSLECGILPPPWDHAKQADERQGARKLAHSKGIVANSR